MATSAPPLAISSSDRRTDSLAAGDERDFTGKLHGASRYHCRDGRNEQAKQHIDHIVITA